MRRRALFILAGVAIFLIVLASAVFYAHSRLPGWLTERINAEITTALNRQMPGLYKVEMQQLELHNLFSSIEFPSIILSPDYRFVAQHDDSLLPRRIVEAEIRGLVVSSGGLIALARNQTHITFSTITLQDAHVVVLYNPAGKTFADEADNSSPQLESISFQNFVIENARMEQRLFADTTRILASLDSVRFQGEIIHTMAGPESKTMVDDFWLTTGKGNIHPEDNLYGIHYDRIEITGTDSIIAISSLHLKPIFGKDEMQNYFTHQTDRIDARFHTVTLKGTDLNSTLNSRRFVATLINFDNGEIDVFRDRNFPLDLVRRPKMPSGLIAAAPFELIIDSIQISNTSIMYSERPEGASRNSPGKVPFHNLTATITNITNGNEALAKDSIMRITARAMIFNKAPLSASFIFNLKDLTGGYLVRGELGGMDLAAINPALYPLSGVTVTEGTHHRSEFFFSGNNIRSEGELKMYYSGLMLQTDQEGNRFRQEIVKFLGRTLVYHPSNPGTRKRMRTGTIAFDRDPSRFAFHYWWQSYLTGIKSTVLRNHEP